MLKYNPGPEIRTLLTETHETKCGTAQMKWKLLFFQIFIVIMVGVSFIFFEISTRVYLASHYDWGILLYGTNYCCGTDKTALFNRRAKNRLVYEKFHTVKNHGKKKEGYSKYFPYENVVDYDNSSSNSFSVEINRY